MGERRGSPNDRNRRKGSVDASPQAGENTHRATFDWSDPDQPSATLVEVIAAIRGADPMDIEPLHDYVDPDALNALFDRPTGKRAPAAVSIAIDGYEIRIDREGNVVADPQAE